MGVGANDVDANDVGAKDETAAIAIGGVSSSRFERLAAFQATGSVARRDEPTKWAHALGREIADPRFHAQPLSQRRCHKGTQAAHNAKEPLRVGSHG
jgi:hypothetical protein